MLLQVALFHSFLWLSNILLYIYTPHLYSFICQWTFMLLPCLGYCKQCCYEHWDAYIFLNQSFLQIYAQEWNCQVIWQFYFQFFKEPPYCFPQWPHQFTFPLTVQEDSLFSTPSPAFIICRLFNDGHSDRCEVIPHCSFDLHFSKLAMLSIFSCAYGPSVCLLWRNVYFGPMPIF